MTQPLPVITLPVSDLSCLTGPDMAAIALKMQQTAMEAEARIFELERRLRAAVNRPTIIQTSTAPITGIVAAPAAEQFVGPLGGGAFVTSFNNTGTSFNIDTGPTGGLGDQLGEGLYEIGLFCNLTASGAVTDNSVRYFRIEQNRPEPTAPDNRLIVHRVGYTLFESNTGVGVDCCLFGEFRIRPGDFVRFNVEHANAGSTLTAPAGTIVWVSKISSSDPVVVM